MCEHKYVLRYYGAECNKCFDVIERGLYWKLPEEQRLSWHEIDPASFDEEQEPADDPEPTLTEEIRATYGLGPEDWPWTDQDWRDELDSRRPETGF